MISRIEETVRKYRLFQRGARLLVAFSGGADSTALLHALAVGLKEWELRLVAAHLHHGIRGAEADADAEFAQLTAWRLGVPCVIKRVDVRARAVRTGESLEMAARSARLEFFREVVQSHGAEAVAVGHTLDDAAETFLLKLLRGSSLAGLGGLAPVSVVEGIRLVRPLIEIGRQEIESFLRAHCICWREDSTNRDLSILRNRVRQVLLPLLERDFQPRIREILARTAEGLRGDWEWIEPMICQASAEAAISETALSAEGLRRMPTALRRHVLARWLRRAGVPPAELDAALIQAVDRMVCEKEAAAVDAGGLVRIEVGDGLLRAKNLKVAADFSVNVVAPPVELPVPGDVYWSPAGVRIRAERGRGIIRPRRGPIGRAPAEAAIRPPEPGEVLVVRPPWPGARISPIGLTGRVKLQDLFVNEKVPRAARARVPVVACGNEVVWVPGYGVSRSWRVPSEEAPCVRLKLEEGPDNATSEDVSDPLNRL